MEKYELIKKYPGSPELGYVSSPKTEIDNTMTNNHYYSGSWFNPSLFPDFWRKVEKLDYEILTVTPYEKNINNTNKEAVIAYKMCNKDLESWNIHSVKRLSDGEIFSIGDSVDFGNKKPNKVDSIGFHSGNLKNLWCFYNSKKLNGANIQLIKKPKTPLFTTEDGVEIYEGDIIWHTNLNYQYLKDCVYSSKVNKSDKPYTPVKGLYSSKEKAEEYILINKPCLSIKDVCPIFGKLYLDNSKDALDRITAKLQELVKSKL